MKSAYNRRQKKKYYKKLFILPVVLVVAVIGFLLWDKTDVTKQDKQPEAVESDKQPDVLAEQKKSTDTVPDQEDLLPEEPKNWPVTYTTEQAASLTVVVNKKHKLPADYVPQLQSVAGGQLRPEAASALATMLEAAQTAGVPMRIISSYRSYETQVSTYNRWVEVDGQAQADRSSARAGHSEHQTGLAVDLGTPDSSCDLAICFGDTAQGQWLAEHAQEYGFIVRYGATTEAVTGYQYEPWHMRYVGVSVATDIKNSGKTLDEYYNIPAGGYAE